MGSSCTCIKKANENEIETLGLKGAKLASIIKIQKIWRGFITRKKMKHSRKTRNMQGLNKNNYYHENAGILTAPQDNQSLDEDLYNKQLTLVNTFFL
jgi:hypothetical protein